MSSTTPIVPNASEDLATAFAADPRIYFNQVTARWQFEDDDGKEMEWDIVKGTWVEVIDEELIQAQQAAYKVDGVAEDEVAGPVKKRKNDGEAGSVPRPKRTKGGKKDRFYQEDPAEAPAAGPSTAEKEKPVKPVKKSKNTAVFISGLPLDTSFEEVRSTFSKFGLIEIDDSDAPKIKFYADQYGNFNGQALVVYFKEESVDLAISMLDDAELRFGQPNTRMGVRKADFGHKAGEGGAVTTEAKEYKPRALDKKAATRRIGKMQSKLNDWDDEDGFGPSSDAPTSASALALKGRVVVLKHMFTLKDLEDDPGLLIELKNDVREECETLGDVTNVVLYDQEADGVITVKFRDSVSAQACIQKMNGRFFDGRKVSAELYTGKERFRKSGGVNDLLMEDGDETEKKRLDAFASWLEGQEN